MLMLDRRMLPRSGSTIVQPRFDFVGTRQLSFKEWAVSTCRGDHKAIDPNAFAGWMRPLSVYGVPAAAIKIQCGLTAVDHGDNTYRYERTRRDVRLATWTGTMHYFRSL